MKAYEFMHVEVTGEFQHGEFCSQPRNQVRESSAMTLSPSQYTAYASDFKSCLGSVIGASCAEIKDQILFIPPGFLYYVYSS